MKIELITKKDFEERIYVRDENLKEIISSLTKKKTLSISDIENFRSKTSDAQILRTFRS